MQLESLGALYADKNNRTYCSGKGGPLRSRIVVPRVRARDEGNRVRAASAWRALPACAAPVTSQAPGLCPFPCSPPRHPPTTKPRGQAWAGQWPAQHPLSVWSALLGVPATPHHPTPARTACIFGSHGRVGEDQHRGFSAAYRELEASPDGKGGRRGGGVVPSSRSRSVGFSDA